MQNSKARGVFCLKRLYRFGVLSLIVSLLLVGCLGGGGKGYQVSGIIQDASGLGIEGVELALLGSKTSLTAKTGADGSWSAQGLTGKVTITPTKEGWSFDPASLEVTKESKTVNFTGIAQVLPEEEYDVSGVVADGLGIGIEGVQLSLTGEDIALVVQTAADGTWKAEGLTGRIEITPSKEGWFFNPSFREVTMASENVDFTGVKGEDLSIVIEGGGTVRQDIVTSVLSVDHYPRKTEVQLTAEPDFDWFFYAWEGDVPEGQEKENPIIITMDEPKQIKAVFKEKTRVNGYIGLEHSFPAAVEQLAGQKTSVGSSGGLKTREPVRDGLDALLPSYPEDEEIIRFVSSMSRAEQEEELRRNGYEILDTIEILNAHLVRRTPNTRVQVATDMSGVLSMERNYDVQLAEIKIPNDRYYPGYQAWHYEQIRLPQAWAVTTGDKSIRVAVVDTGISTEHPDLIANVNLELGANFVPGDDVDYIEDHHGHGSHVSGTIGAVTNNETGMAGVMWEVEIIPVRVFDASGRGSTWTVVNGLLYAAGLLDDQEDKPSIGRPADIVNMSLGGPGSEFQYDAVQRAVANDVILIAATGNDERNLISYPAQYDEVIAVGATAYNWGDVPELAYYSNTGMGIDVVAPGGGGIQGVPYGYVWSTGDGGSYYGSGGTSMATPHVSGVVGLMLANGIPKSEIREVLRRTSMEIHIRGFNDTYGYGLVNAYWAVNAVKDMRIIQGLRNGNEIEIVAETTVPAKGEQFRFEVVQGQYQLIAWVDVNGNDVLDTSDYYTETPVLEFGYGEGWSWWGNASEVGEMTEVPIPSLDEAESQAIREW